MKKILIIFLTITMITWANPVGATPPDYCGGVNNEYEYQEMVFLSGEPIKFSGKMTVTDRTRGDVRTLTYNFTLTPEDKTITGKLTRKATYEIDYTQHDTQGQTTAQETVKSYNETVTLGKNKYVLDDYQLSRGDVIDNRPASDFSSGTMTARKHYTINKTEGEAVVETSGGDVGYQNFWGSTETQTNNTTINVDTQTKDSSGDSETVSWEGTVKNQVTDTMNKTLKYADNEADYSSFSGGYARVTSEQMNSKYTYDLPEVDDGVVDNDSRNRGTSNLSEDMTPKVERLIVPKFRDISGHWAEDDINQLYALDVFDGSSTFFLADIPMTRVDFIRAVIKAADMRPTLAATTSKTTTKKKVAEQSPFKDVAVSDSDYQYVKEAVDKGIISGVSADQFDPQGSLTRAQAVTILIKALGFEGRAPAPGYSTGFYDDSSIPYWAKDSIYVASELGLLKGDNNYIYPNRVMTRAEASALLVSFLNFLQVDLQKDYSDNIVQYN